MKKRTQNKTAPNSNKQGHQGIFATDLYKSLAGYLLPACGTTALTGFVLLLSEVSGAWILFGVASTFLWLFLCEHVRISSRQLRQKKLVYVGFVVCAAFSWGFFVWIFGSTIPTREEFLPDANELSNKAKIDISIIQYDPFVVAEPFRLAITVTSEGESAAENVKVFRSVRVLETEKLPNKPPYEAPDSANIPVDAYLKKGKTLVAGHIYPGFDLLTLREIQDKTRNLFAFGFVTYTDIFRSKRGHYVAEFYCFKYEPEKKRFELCTSHRFETEFNPDPQINW